MINRGCTEIVIGTEWEPVLFPKPLDGWLKEHWANSEAEDKKARPWMYTEGE